MLNGWKNFNSTIFILKQQLLPQIYLFQNYIESICFHMANLQYQLVCQVLPESCANALLESWV